MPVIKRNARKCKKVVRISSYTMKPSVGLVLWAIHHGLSVKRRKYIVSLITPFWMISFQCRYYDQTLCSHALAWLSVIDEIEWVWFSLKLHPQSVVPSSGHHDGQTPLQRADLAMMTFTLVLTLKPLRVGHSGADAAKGLLWIGRMKVLHEQA